MWDANLSHGFGYHRFSACRDRSTHLIHMIPTYEDWSLHLILLLQKHHILLYFLLHFCYIFFVTFYMLRKHNILLCFCYMFLLHFTCYGNITLCYVFCYVFCYIFLLHFTCYGNITFCYIFCYIFFYAFFLTFFFVSNPYIWSSRSHLKKWGSIPTSCIIILKSKVK